MLCYPLPPGSPPSWCNVGLKLRPTPIQVPHKFPAALGSGHCSAWLRALQDRSFRPILSRHPAVPGPGEPSRSLSIPPSLFPALSPRILQVMSPARGRSSHTGGSRPRALLPPRSPSYSSQTGGSQGPGLSEAGKDYLSFFLFARETWFGRIQRRTPDNSHSIVFCFVFVF